jgi:methylase of polypeptide subunit release factors
MLALWFQHDSPALVFQVLMAYLSTMEDSLLKQSSVLELGSGCGAVGMYAAMRGLFSAWLQG